MSLLAWRSATSADRSALSQFECTPREKRVGRTVYPRAWERQAEVAVRKANPRGSQNSAVLLGCDSDGIACVVSVGANPNYGSAYMVELIAVATRHRGQGGEIADEALEEALQWALAQMDAAGNRAPVVFADLDNRNHAARALLVRHAFHLELRPTPTSELWIYEPGELPFD